MSSKNGFSGAFACVRLRFRARINAIMEAINATPAIVQATAIPTCAAVERLDDVDGEEKDVEAAVEVASALPLVATTVVDVEPIKVDELKTVAEDERAVEVAVDVELAMSSTVSGPVVVLPKLSAAWRY